MLEKVLRRRRKKIKKKFFMLKTAKTIFPLCAQDSFKKNRWKMLLDDAHFSLPRKQILFVVINL